MGTEAGSSLLALPQELAPACVLTAQLHLRNASADCSVCSFGRTVLNALLMGSYLQRVTAGAATAAVPTCKADRCTCCSAGSSMRCKCATPSHTEDNFWLHLYAPSGIGGDHDCWDVPGGRHIGKQRVRSPTPQRHILPGDRFYTSVVARDV